MSLSPGGPGDPTCPCINATALLIGLSSLSVIPNRTDVYGSLECQSWDAKRLECNSTDAPDWCAAQWCYVDRDACHSAKFLIHASHEFPLLESLFYSYGTCGVDQPDNYDDYLSAHLGEGRAIRVGVPFSVYPQHYKRDSAGKVYSGGNEPGSIYFDDSVPWEGYFIDYIRNLSAIAPWGNLSFHSTSEGARIEFNESRWDAAVQDVGSGINDVAVSDFWVTKRRANLATFSNNIYEESVYLFVPRPSLETDTGFIEAALGIFQPFGVSLWLAILAAVVGMAMVNMLLSSVAMPTLSPCYSPCPAATKEEESEEATKEEEEKETYLEQLRDSLMQLLTGVDGGKQDTPGRSLANVGWAIFALITLTAYTANLAAFLVVPSEPSLTITSMSAAVEMQVTICTFSPLNETILQRYPNAKLHILTEDEFGSNYSDSYRAYGCSAAIDTLERIKVEFEAAVTCCELGLFALELISDVAVAFPARPWLAPSLSYWSIHLEQAPNTSFRESAPFLFDTCQGVLDKQKQEEAVLGTSETSERRRLVAAKGGAAGAATILTNDGESTGVVAAAMGLPWTERGGVVVDDLTPFEVKNLGAVFGLWFLFCSFAIAKALWNSNSDRVQATRKSAVGDSDAPEGADMVENAMKDVLPIIEAAVRKAMSTTILEVQATVSSKVVDTRLTATSSQG